MPAAFVAAAFDASLIDDADAYVDLHSYFAAPPARCRYMLRQRLRAFSPLPMPCRLPLLCYDASAATRADAFHDAAYARHDK